jgi:catechol 2,3-dioxygenase-like lactoylglutathione lyase family enzyme
MIVIDHIAVLARDVAASAQFLAEILGLAPGYPDGPENRRPTSMEGETGAYTARLLLAR